MPKTILPIANGFYLSESLPISAQECVNWYPNIVQAPGLNQETLFGTAGIIPITSAGDNPALANRSSHTFEGVPYFVQGSRLFSMTIDGVLTDLGFIEGSERVSIANNGLQMMLLVPGGTGYIYDTTNGLQEITDPGFRANGAPQFVEFIDGYFVCTTDEKKFIISAINDGLSWNPLDFGTAESSPDETVLPIVYKNQLFIGGRSTLEGFNNIGGSDFPFRRTGLFLDEGVFAPFSVVVTHNTFMFIGGQENEEPAVWSLVGNQLQKVSTTAIDNLLNDLTQEELEQVGGNAYGQNGQFFVGWALPKTTIVYDIITGRWHERKSRIVKADGTVSLERWRVNGLAAAYGNVYCGDSQDGRIGIIDEDTYTEYGNPIFRRVATQPFQNNMDAFFVPHIELTMEAGVGDENTPEPKIRMDRSLDGKTFKDDRTRKIGKIGEFNKRTIWRRNGRAARFEIFRFTLTDPVKPVIIQLTAQIEGAAA